jgi:FlaA1/EpsC-like NDP-sugar epimerase
LLLDQDETGIFNISEELRNAFPKLIFYSLICDIQEEKKVGKIFNQYRPNIIFHAAAYKHVPLMEEHPDEAVKNNIFGTKIVAKASLMSGVEKFIFISTDKAVNPVSVMGITKRIGEIMCQVLNQSSYPPHQNLVGGGAGNTKFISVRFGNVLDSRGSVIPIFREQIKKGGPVEVTHPEMKRYFMVISEACLLVMQAGAIGEGGEVFVLNMGEPIKILDLAKEMIRFSGLESDKDIPIVFTEPRPGEKLFEEILTAEEGTLATQNQNIFRAKLLAVDESKLSDCLIELEQALESSEKEEIVNVLKNILKELIPSYKLRQEN